MKKELFILCFGIAVCTFGCHRETIFDEGRVCSGKQEIICNDEERGILLSCKKSYGDKDADYEIIYCDNGCNQENNACNPNKCKVSSDCIYENAESSCQEGQCEVLCHPNYKMKADGTGCVAVNCQIDDVSECYFPDNSEAYCKEDLTCDFICNAHFEKSHDGQACEPFKCSKDDVSGCFVPKNGTAICKYISCSEDDASCIGSEQCDFVCKEGYVRSLDGSECEPFVCSEEDVSGCEVPDHGAAICEVSQCEADDEDCVQGSICGYVCDEDYVKTNQGCELVACKGDDVSRCEVPENATAVCEQTTCADGDETCVMENVCRFSCDDGYVRTKDGAGCEPFVCDSEHLDNCQKDLPEYSVATCSDNQCGFECDESHVRDNARCVACRGNDITRCTKKENATISCQNETCEYKCTEGCYSLDADTQSCVMIDTDGNGIPDCYDAIKCNANNVICIKNANEFMHLPDYFDESGNIKPDYEGVYSGKNSHDVTFYLMNDINLADVITSKVDSENKTCEDESWEAPELTNLVLMTPLESEKRIFYQKNIDGQDVNCTMNSSLWESLTDGKVSHLRIELNVRSETAHAAFIEKMTKSELHDVSYSGNFENIATVRDTYNYGGIAGEAVECKMRRVYCDGASYTTPAGGYNVGCVIGWMRGGSFSNSVDEGKTPVVNRIVSGHADYVSGGLIGKVSGTDNGKAVVQDVKNVVESNLVYRSSGGLIGYVENADIQNIDNVITTARGAVECGGLIGNVGPGSRIHGIENTIENGIFGYDYEKKAKIKYLGGLIGAVHSNITEAGSISDKKAEIFDITQNVNDGVQIQGSKMVGGLIGSVNPDQKKQYKTDIYDIHNTMSDVLGMKPDDIVGGLIGFMFNADVHDIENTINSVSGCKICGGLIGKVDNKLEGAIYNIHNEVSDVLGMKQNGDTGGGLIGEADGSSEHILSIHNVTNEVKKVEDVYYGGGFISDGSYLKFEKIDNRFERIVGYASVGGFVGAANVCDFVDIRNKNILGDDDAFYGVLKKNNTISGLQNLGVGGFANMIKGTSKFASNLKNIDNDVHVVENQDSGCNAAGFVDNVNNFYHAGAVTYKDIILEHISNKVGVVKSEKTMAGGFSTYYIQGTMRNIKNEVGELIGNDVAGFGCSFDNTSFDAIETVAEKIAATETAAGFSTALKGSDTNTITQVSSIVRYMDLQAVGTATGFAIFDSANYSLKDVSSAVKMKYASTSKACGAVYQDMKKNLAEILEKILMENFVIYADLNSTANNNHRVDRQVSQANFTPAAGSSFYYYAEESKYKPMPTDNCNGACIGYSKPETVKDVVEALNDGKEPTKWKQGTIVIENKNVSMPVLNLDDIGFIEPEGGVGYKEAQISE